MGCNCKDEPVTTEYLGDVAIYALANLPDYLIGEVDAEDVVSGDVTRSLVRVPTGLIAPTANMANVTTLPNLASLEIPENQVRAGFVHNYGSYNTPEFDDQDHAPQFLILGTLNSDLLVQGTGVITFPAGHEYVVSADYYASADGTGIPTTDSASGIKLFTPISRTQLMVKLS